MKVSIEKYRTRGLRRCGCWSEVNFILITWFYPTKQKYHRLEALPGLDFFHLMLEVRNSSTSEPRLQDPLSLDGKGHKWPHQADVWNAPEILNRIYVCSVIITDASDEWFRCGCSHWSLELSNMNPTHEPLSRQSWFKTHTVNFKPFMLVTPFFVELGTSEMFWLLHIQLYMSVT